MKVLVNCYACSPYKGSEPGMGWNFIKALSKFHELHIITESKFKNDLDKYFSEHPDELKNCHFYFIAKERHKKLRRIWPPSYYWFYKAWQKEAFILAQKLEAQHNFDVVHQLNMIGYREPGYLYRLNKPFVWGPIGGFNITPWKLLPSMGLYGCLFYGCRNLINLWQMHCSRQVKQAIEQSKELISATKDDQTTIKKLWKKNSLIIPEVGFTSNNHVILKTRKGKLRICWSGIHIPRKALNLLLEAVNISKYKEQIELHVLGAGSYTKKWEKLAKEFSIKNIEWHGWVEKEKALEIMQDTHVFAITSLSDATSTVLLEALSYGLPVIALDHLGFSNIITPKCGIKVKVQSKKQVLRDFAFAIDQLFEDEPLRQRLAKGALKRAKDFTWEEKAQTIHSLYLRAIES